MHLCIAASPAALCWAACWAVACETKTAAENPNANAKKSLFALLMVYFLSVGSLRAHRRLFPRSRTGYVSPDKGMRFP